MKINLSTRLVILIGNYVFKIPINFAGYMQSENESYLYKKYKDLGMLGKIHWSFLGIICMKRYQPVKRVLKSYIKGIQMVIPELDVVNHDLGIVHNWGKEDGYFVLVDYGIKQFKG